MIGIKPRSLPSKLGFRPFNPVDLFKRNEQKKTDAFRRELYEALDSPEFINKLPAKRQFTESVYTEKVNEMLFGELVGRKLVSEKRHGDFIYFEKNTSLVYMAILAKYLADIDDQLAIPSTDLGDYEHLNFNADSSVDRGNPCVRAEFRDLLRVPSDDVEIGKVIDFRLKRNDELLNFRQQVLDKFENEIKKCGDRNEIKDKTIGFKNQIEKSIKDLDALLKEGKFQTVMGTLKAIFKPQHITTAGDIAAVGGLGTGSAEVTAIAGIAGLAFGGAVEVSDFFVSRKNARLDKLRSNAYSYLYQAEKQFGRKHRGSSHSTPPR